jgi:hypothetical protein
MTSPAEIDEVSVIVIVLSVGAIGAVIFATGRGCDRKNRAISGSSSGRARSKVIVWAPGFPANGLNDIEESLTDPGWRTGCQSSHTRDEETPPANAESPGNGTDVIAIGIAAR